MYFYKFNISDYLSHTAHLSEIEDLAYRRMLDWYYLHEKPLPKDVDLIAKNIRMRSYNECITNVLREFFIDTENGFENNRANSEIITYCEKSEKAKASIKTRWDKNKNKNKELPDCTNVLRTKYERNTKQETLNTKQETLNTKQETLNTKQETLVNFDDFWNLYPRKEGKTKAKQSWDKQRITSDLFNNLIKPHLEIAFIAVDHKFIPHGSTYVNQKRWEDEVTKKSKINNEDQSWAADLTTQN